MAKNRNKKKKNGSESMAMDLTSGGHSVMDVPQAMDMSEAVASKPSAGGTSRKLKKGRPMKRSKNLRKMQAVAKAISQFEKSEEKISKSENKTLRTVFGKKLYD